MARRGCPGIKRIEKLIDQLEDIRRTATMNNMNINEHFSETYTVKGNEITEFVKKHTGIWRESWLVSPLSEIIKEFKQFV